MSLAAVDGGGCRSEGCQEWHLVDEVAGMRGARSGSGCRSWQRSGRRWQGSGNGRHWVVRSDRL